MVVGGCSSLSSTAALVLPVSANAGMGTNCTSITMVRTKESRRCRGVDFIIIPPFVIYWANGFGCRNAYIKYVDGEMNFVAIIVRLYYLERVTDLYSV
jgi:hypothetical protein